MLLIRQLARWFEWVFGMVLMVALGVIVILPLLSGFSRWALIVGLFLYLIATLVRLCDDARIMKIVVRLDRQFGK